jgi:peptide deformylase
MKAHSVTVSEIPTPKIQSVIRDMKAALHQEYDGVGIAAPQIGESLRIFVVAGRVLKRKTFDPAEIDKEKNEKKWKDDIVLINPEIIKLSKDQKFMEEGCLSVRPLYGLVKRSSRATIRAYDENGELFERGASGLLAQIFQHEVDHLEGILFTDKATEVQSMPEHTYKHE